MKENKKRLNLYMDDSLFYYLSARAKAEDIPVAVMARKMIKQVVDAEIAKEPELKWKFENGKLIPAKDKLFCPCCSEEGENIEMEPVTVNSYLCPECGTAHSVSDRQFRGVLYE